MKAVRIHSTGGYDVMKVEQCEIPKLLPGQVRVKNQYAGVNYIDTYHRSGLYTVKFPFILGRDGAGVVEEIMEDPQNSVLHDLKVGDRVAYPGGTGSYAEYTCSPLVNTIKVPDSIKLDDATTAMVQGLTAHYLVVDSYRIKKGDSVLVQAAAGGLGQIIVQLAKLQGATKVIGTTSSEEKAKIAKTAGCDDIILYTKQNVVEETRRLTGGKGVNVVYDGVGKDTWDKSLDCLARRGFLVLCGNASGKVPPFDPLLLSQKGSLSVTRPILNDFIVTREEFVSRCNDIFNWMQQGKLKLTFDKVFSLSDAAEAHRYLESRQAAGKLLFKL